MIRQKKNFVGYFIILLLALVLPLFFNSYVQHLLVMILIYSELSLSLNIIMGDMKQFSFGHQTYFGVAAFTTAIFTVKLGMPVWLGFIAGITSAFLLGLLIGYISLKDCRGFRLGIVTMGFAQITYLVAMQLKNITGGLTGIPKIPPIVLGGIRLDNPLKFYYFALFILLCSMYIINVWENSRIGKAVKAIGKNEALSKSIGINSYKLYVVAFTFACILAGVAGVTYAHYMRQISCVPLGQAYMFGMLVMVIIGGKGTIGGPILGSIIYVLLPEFFMITMEWRLFIFGVLVLFCIIFMKEGLYPFLVSICKNVPYLKQVFRK